MNLSRRTFKQRKLNRFLVLSLIAVFLGVYAAYLSGARINRTHSLPTGIYWVDTKQPERGDIVAFRPTDTPLMREARRRGYIIGGRYDGYGPLLKRLLAVPGDTVSITADGITVNGQAVPNTTPIARDNLGNPLPALNFLDYVLRHDEALFISDHLPTSFDSRYFGPQKLNQIIDVLKPVWIWSNHPNQQHR